MSLEWLYDPEKELVDGLATTSSPQMLEDYFASRTSRWKHSYIIAEAGTFGTFGDLRLKPDSAFRLIPAAVNVALRQADSDLFASALGLLDTLARISNTTELPLELKENWESLEQKAKEFSTHRDCQTNWQEFARWYRVKPTNAKARN